MQASLRYKLTLLLMFSVAYSVFYLFPNFYPLRPPALLPLLPIDSAIPLIPWTFLIYASDYLLPAFAIWIIKSEAKFSSFARMAFLGLFICGIFFILLPTRYPRPPYPAVDNLIVQFFMDLISKADTPNNCFPSMHVAMTGISTWNLRDKPKVFCLFLIWAAAIYVSTLTTKQHYLVDILGGLGVIFVSIVVERFFFERKTGLVG